MIKNETTKFSCILQKNYEKIVYYLVESKNFCIFANSFKKPVLKQFNTNNKWQKL